MIQAITKPKTAETEQDSFFLPYQRDWIQDRSTKRIMEKSRQIGMSWSTAYDLVRSKSLEGCKWDAWVTSRDSVQATLFLEDCRNFANILTKGAEALGNEVLDGDARTASFVLRFVNGCRIHSMSSNPDAQAGKRGDRVLDEFALHPEARKLFAIAWPGITWGGRMSLISTHRGTEHLFNSLIQEIKHNGNPKGFSLHTVTLQDALDQGFLQKLKAKLREGGVDDDERLEMDEAEYFDWVRAGCVDEESFMQEYMCVPSDDASAFLTYEQITSCEYTDDDQWEQPLEAITSPLYVGVDVGRDHDLTVIWVLEKVADMYFTRAVIEMQNTKFSEQEKVLYPILENPNVKRCCIDCNGIGRQFSERAQDRFKTRVEPVTFTLQSKEEMAYPLRAAFEDKTLRIPRSREIEKDLRSIKKVTTAAGNVRFAADRGENGHADRFWALALARLAGTTAKPLPFLPWPFRNNRRNRVLRGRRERKVFA